MQVLEQKVLLSVREEVVSYKYNRAPRRNTLKRFIYFIILAMSLTLVFSQGKPCCKNKSGKGKVSCKFNRAQIDGNKDGITTADEIQTTEKAGVQCPNKPGCICSKSVSAKTTNQKKCDSCANVKWWKFWAKKNNCCNTKT